MQRWWARTWHLLHKVCDQRSCGKDVAVARGHLFLLLSGQFYVFSHIMFTHDVLL